LLDQQGEETFVLAFVPEEIIAYYDVGVFFLGVVFEAVYDFLRELLVLMVRLFSKDLVVDLPEDAELASDELLPFEGEEGLKSFLADVFAD